MKFTIHTQEFNYLISKCLNVISAKPSIPILSNFVIEASNNTLQISATDLIVSIRCTSEVHIQEEGATTLPAKKLAQLIRELTSATIELTTNPNEVTEIIADSSKFKLHGMNRAEFPELPDLSQAVKLTLKQSVLKDLLFRTAFAICRDENRYVLTGAYFQVSNGRITLIGTDGKRLARSILDIEDPSVNAACVIPLKAVDEVIKNLSDDGDVDIFFMPDKVAFQINGLLLITKLLVGDYPDILRVIPPTVPYMIPLHREELMTLLRQTLLFTTEEHPAVKFIFSPGELQLDAHAMEIGEGKVSMPANYQGEQLEIAFSPNVFLDVLKHCSSEVILLCLTDAYNPGVVIDQETTIYNVEELPSLFVMMPMRLDDE